MADQNRQQQEYNARLAEAKKLIQDINRLRVQLNQEPLRLGDDEAVRNIKLLRSEFNQLANDISGVDDSASSLFQQMVGIAKEFKAVTKPATQLKNAFKGMVAQAAKMKNDELGLVDLRTRDLDTIEKKLKIQNEAARIAAGQFEGQRAAYDAANAIREQELGLQKEINDLSREAAELEAQGLVTASLIRRQKLEEKERNLNNLTARRLNISANISDEAAAAFEYLDDQDSAYHGILSQVEKRKQEERQISKLTGVTGALVGGTGALMERLGMRSGIFHDAMKDSAEEMRQMAKDTAKGVKKYSQLQIAAKGFSVVAKGFGQALLDPAAIVGGIVSAFLDVNKAGVELTRLTGKTSEALAGTVTQASNLVDLMNTSSELTKQTGLNAATIFSPEQIGQLSDAKNLLGISAEQAGNLGMIMKLTNESADQLGESIYDNVDAGVSKKLVYDDILSTSDDIVASTGGNTEELARSASAAKKLGMDLAKVNEIADGLMDFETSIGNELEAQLLTGKNINLAKARELALNNDLKGVAEELSKNGASAAEFAKMNRIQQESLAKALGMSRQELGKMVLTEKARAEMTDEQIAAARGVTLEQSKQMDIQEKMSKLTSNLLQQFAPLLEAFLPIVDVLIKGLRGAMIVLQPLIEGFRLIGSLVDYMVEGVKEGKAPAIALAASLTLLAAPLIISAIGAIFTALSSLGPIGVGLGFVAAAGLISLITKAKTTTADDMVSQPGYGKRTLMGPEGAIQLNNRDTVIAGTDLFSGGEQESVTSTIGGVDLSPLITEIRQMKTEVSSVLKSILNKEGTVTLDGNKVGSALVLGSYKSS